MGTHPIFESDFDCLTEMPRQITEIKQFLVNARRKDAKSVKVKQTKLTPSSRFDVQSICIHWLFMIKTKQTNCDFLFPQDCKSKISNENKSKIVPCNSTVHNTVNLCYSNNIRPKS